VLATVSTRPGELVLTTHDGQSSMPSESGDVRVIVDGPIIEVSSRGGVIAAPIAAPGNGLELTTEGRVRVWPLSR
jgi:beta-fructofuranosidase